MTVAEYVATMAAARDELARADYIDNWERAQAVKRQELARIREAWITTCRPLPGSGTVLVKFRGAIVEATEPYPTELEAWKP